MCHKKLTIGRSINFRWRRKYYPIAYESNNFISFADNKLKRGRISIKESITVFKPSELGKLSTLVIRSIHIID
jgi:hypothetical protein